MQRRPVLTSQPHHWFIFCLHVLLPEPLRAAAGRYRLGVGILGLGETATIVPVKKILSDVYGQFGVVSFPGFVTMNA